MEIENIKKSNKLIAEFMGYRILLLFNLSEIPFHKDWNFLMPVVERIENMGYDVFINGLYCRITDSGMSDFEIESGECQSKIEAIWQAVVEFIK